MQWMNKRKNTRGAALVEYVVLMAIVGGLAIFSVFQLGGEIRNVYGDLDTVVAEETDSVLEPGGPGGGGPGGGGTTPTGPVVFQIQANYGVRCTETYVTDLGAFANQVAVDYFTNGGQVGFGDRWGVDVAFFYEEGGDPIISLQDDYDQSIDWTTVPSWDIVDVVGGSTSYDLTLGAGNASVLYNPHANGVEGWSDPSLSSCFEGSGDSLIYTLEAEHPSGTLLRFIMAVYGQS